MKNYVVWLDSGVSIKANSEKEAGQLAKIKFLEMISNNQADYIAEEDEEV